MSLRGGRQEDAQRRALLFGAAPARGGAPQQAAGGAASGEREMLEGRNDACVDGLRGRVGEMRHLAIDLGAEVRGQNEGLDGMAGGFDKAGDAINRTIREVKRLSASGGGGHMCVLAVFAAVLFVLIYLLLR